MEKIVSIDGKPVKLRATAALPRRFRDLFGIDFFSALENIDKENKSLERKEKKTPPDDKEALADLESAKVRLSGKTMELFENLAFIMARSADPENVPPDIADWLDSIDDPNAILKISGDVIELYRANNKTTAIPKKKKKRRNGK